MLPALRSGDVVSVHRANLADVLPGEVVVFMSNRHLVAHRVVRHALGDDGVRIVTRGDACLHDDLPVSEDDFLGVVRGVAPAGDDRWSKWVPAALRSLARFLLPPDLICGLAHRARATLAHAIARTMSTIASRYPARSTLLAARTADGRLVIITSTNCTVVTLNEVAAAIWAGADGRTTLTDIVERAVCGNFDIDPNVARRDAEAFVVEMFRQGILVRGGLIVNAPVGTSNEFAA